MLLQLSIETPICAARALSELLHPQQTALMASTNAGDVHYPVTNGTSEVRWKSFESSLTELVADTLPLPQYSSFVLLNVYTGNPGD